MFLAGMAIDEASDGGVQGKPTASWTRTRRAQGAAVDS
jgi:hypothetical protein